MSIDVQKVTEAAMAALDDKPVRPQFDPATHQQFIEGIKHGMADVFRDIESKASPETLTELQGIGHAFEQYAWKAGWATEKLYQEVIANGGRRTVEDCCWYVSISSFNGMRSMNTVKRYLHNARFFSPKTVAEFDSLPFSTFEYARSHPNGWKPVLETAMHEAEKWGKPQSVAKLRELIDGKTKVKKKPAITYDLSTNLDVSFAGSLPVVTKSNKDDDEIRSQVTQALSTALNAMALVIPLVAKVFPNLGIASARIVTILRKIENAVLNGKDAEIPVP